jgi:hypothetical protein
VVDFGHELITSIHTPLRWSSQRPTDDEFQEGFNATRCLAAWLRTPPPPLAAAAAAGWRAARGGVAPSATPLGPATAPRPRPAWGAADAHGRGPPCCCTAPPHRLSAAKVLSSALARRNVIKSLTLLNSEGWAAAAVLALAAGLGLLCHMHRLN